jgi:short-subunit dehydrogenase
MSKLLSDQVVLVTGASAGIGEVVALKAADQGAKLILAARREGVLQTLKDLITQKGGEALVVAVDMADPDQVRALAQKTLDHFGRVDILVNNAGYSQAGPIEEVPEEAVRHQFEVNVFGLLTLTRSLIPEMRQRGSGRIINLSSVSGQISMPFSGIYNASKFAVEALSDALRVEVAPFGIQVIVIEPGPVKTDFFRTMQETATANMSPAGPYRAVWENMQEIMGSFKGLAWPVEKVADRILQAMTDAKPSSRYTAFTGGKVGLGLMQIMPAALGDWMWKRIYGLEHLAAKPNSPDQLS